MLYNTPEEVQQAMGQAVRKTIREGMLLPIPVLKEKVRERLAEFFCEYRPAPKFEIQLSREDDQLDITVDCVGGCALIKLGWHNKKEVS